MSANIFLKQLDPSSTSQSSLDNIFLNQMQGMPEPPESRGKSFARTALQIPLGYLKRYPASYLPDLFKLMSEGASRETLAQLAEEEPELKGGVAEEARQKGIQAIPTQETVEKLIEEQLGIPMRPQTELQKNLRLGSTAAAFKPGGAVEKAAAGIIAPTAKKGLEAAGLPEEVSEPISLVASGLAPTPEIAAKTKPSGMKTRFFERLKKPTKVSPHRHTMLNEALENDFRNITESILNKNPDYASIKNDPNYKVKLNEAFEKVSDLASDIQEQVNSRQLNSFLKRRMNTHHREMKGITPSESEQTFRKEFGSYINSVHEGPFNFSIKDLVEQYRKNNSELAEYFEPGKSKAFNTGKRDALLEYNRGIEELFETVHPNSEFTRLFRDQNRKWSQMADVEAIEGRLDKVFGKEKISFGELDKILDKSNSNVRRPFQRMMGKEGFNRFESLLRDFKSVQNPYGLIKKAEIGGFKDLAKLAAAYLAHPSLAKLKVTKDLISNGLRVLLDKPELAITWKNAIDSLKAGKFPEAQEQFKELDSQVKELSEKVKPFSRRARTVPEEYSPEFGEKVFEANARYYEYPSVRQIKDFNLNEPYDLVNITSLTSTEIMPLNRNEKVLFNNEWKSLLNEKEFDKYYNSKLGDIIGTVGDFIKNPKLRKIYKNVLDTPIRVNDISGSGSYNPNFKSISIRKNLSPSDFYGTLIHETHHSLQDTFNRLTNFKKPQSIKEYLTLDIEKKARLAERYAKKDLLKARHTKLKTQKFYKEGLTE